MLRVVDRAAQALIGHGVGTDTIVGICMGRSTGLVNAMLAVLEAGATYLPLDATYPPGRLEQILNSAAPALIIADEATAPALRSLAKCPVVTFDRLANPAARGRDVAAPKRQLA